MTTFSIGFWICLLLSSARAQLCTNCGNGDNCGSGACTCVYPWQWSGSSCFCLHDFTCDDITCAAGSNKVVDYLNGCARCWICVSNTTSTTVAVPMSAAVVETVSECAFANVLDRAGCFCVQPDGSTACIDVYNGTNFIFHAINNGTADSVNATVVAYGVGYLNVDDVLNKGVITGCQTAGSGYVSNIGPYPCTQVLGFCSVGGSSCCQSALCNGICPVCNGRTLATLPVTSPPCHNGCGDITTFWPSPLSWPSCVNYTGGGSDAFGCPICTVCVAANITANGDYDVLVKCDGSGQCPQVECAPAAYRAPMRNTSFEGCNGNAPCGCIVGACGFCASTNVGAPVLLDSLLLLSIVTVAVALSFTYRY